MGAWQLVGLVGGLTILVGTGSLLHSKGDACAFFAVKPVTLAVAALAIRLGWRKLANATHPANQQAGHYSRGVQLPVARGVVGQNNNGWRWSDGFPFVRPADFEGLPRNNQRKFVATG